MTTGVSISGSGSHRGSGASFSREGIRPFLTSSRLSNVSRRTSRVSYSSGAYEGGPSRSGSKEDGGSSSGGEGAALLSVAEGGRSERVRVAVGAARVSSDEGALEVSPQGGIKVVSGGDGGGGDGSGGGGTAATIQSGSGVVRPAVSGSDDEGVTAGDHHLEKVGVLSIRDMELLSGNGTVGGGGGGERGAEASAVTAGCESGKPNRRGRGLHCASPLPPPLTLPPRSPSSSSTGSPKQRPLYPQIFITQVGFGPLPKSARAAQQIQIQINSKKTK